MLNKSLRASHGHAPHHVSSDTPCHSHLRPASVTEMPSHQSQPIAAGRTAVNTTSDASFASHEDKSTLNPEIMEMKDYVIEVLITCLLKRDKT